MTTRLDQIKQFLQQLSPEERAQLGIAPPQQSPMDLLQSLLKQPGAQAVAHPAVAAIEARIGMVKKQNNNVQFKLRIDPAQWPATDPFGRAFPTLEQVATLSRSDMFKYLTSTGWPAFKLPSVNILFFIRPEENQTAYGQPVKAGEWRFLNGAPGKLARAHKANELAQYLMSRGATKEQVIGLWQEYGLPMIAPWSGEAEAAAQPSVVAAPTAKPKRQRKPKAAGPSQHVADESDEPEDA